MTKAAMRKHKLFGATAMLTAALALPAIDFASAESAPEKTMVSFKYLNYAETQIIPGSGSDDGGHAGGLVAGVSGASGGTGVDRIKVNAFTVSTLVPVAGKWTVGLTSAYDTVSGASPQYHTSSLTNMSDRRHAGDVSVTRYFELDTLTIGGSYSSESDYISRGYSIVGSHATPDKNTTWTLGASLTDDTVNPTIPGVVSKSKKSCAGMAGVTLVLTQNDITQLNVGFSHGSGYYSDPYKVSDNRPGTRNIGTVMTRWNHHVEALNSTVRSSYRFYTDSFGIRAHTLEGEYVQPIGRGWTLAPSLRFYAQNEADFYIPTTGANETTAPPVPAGQTYSSFDQRLSAFGAITEGLKIARKVNENVQLDVKYESYRQRSNWAIAGKKDSGLALFNARSIQVGLTCLF